MTAQPEMTGFGRPPAAPSGFRKFVPFIASAATGGLVVMAGLYLMQLGLPERLKPGYVAGTMAGSETVGHLQTSGDEQISYEVRSQAAQQALGLTTNSMQGASAIANIADLMCGASRIAENFAGQEASTRSATTSDAAWWEGFFHRSGDSTCGVGSQMRTAILGEVTGNGRQSGTLSVRDGQQMRPTPITTIDQAFGIMRASRHYADSELKQALDFYHRQVPAVQNALIARLKPDEPGAPDVFTERTFMYASITNSH